MKAWRIAAGALLLSALYIAPASAQRLGPQVSWGSDDAGLGVGGRLEFDLPGMTGLLAKATIATSAGL